MITKVNQNYADTSFGMRFQTRRVIEKDFYLPYLTSDGDFFAKRLNMDSGEMAMRRVQKAFREQFPDLAEAIDNKVLKMQKISDTQKARYFDKERMDKEIDNFIEQMNLNTHINLNI